MSLPVVLSPDADREFEEAAAWYERNAKMGERFVERIQDALNRIKEAPERHATIFGTICRIRVRQFPYGIFNRIKDDRIEAIDVFHDSVIRKSGNPEPEGLANHYEIVQS